MGVHLIDGEIALTGVQLARGYWRNRKKTAENFRMVAIDGAETPAYFTGDIGEMVGDHLFFVARKDHQVKLNGHRL